MVDVAVKTLNEGSLQGQKERLVSGPGFLLLNCRLASSFSFCDSAVLMFSTSL